VPKATCAFQKNTQLTCRLVHFIFYAQEGILAGETLDVICYGWHLFITPVHGVLRLMVALRLGLVEAVFFLTLE